ncbi:MAG: addiction module protein [Candidatus Cyclonatronum sp.]|uniref:addiction module protein n=1 Tax=Cyclonatronum sp. TaxID=3024185 RepID=UPI0025BE1BDD|nr:addiction module protein [Cyclonatronum sp.]MCC5934886.1 addiction module protein [Balneolales bacterium]MCH8487149.1 addiction module protein [Cyclonatronum sp.]
MSSAFRMIENSALELNKNQRAALAKKLINSLDEQVDDDANEAWLDEISRRKAEVKSGKVNTLSGEELHKAVRERLG